MEEVKDAYRVLVKVWHPDRFAQDDTRMQKAAESKMKELNAAYQTLVAFLSQKEQVTEKPHQRNGPQSSNNPASETVAETLADASGVPDRFMRAPTREESQRLLKEAAKFCVEVGDIRGVLRTPDGKLAAGVASDPAIIGKRLIGIVKKYETPDTGYHLLTLTMLRDMTRSGIPKVQQYAKDICAAFGGETVLVELAGRLYFDVVAADATASFGQRIANFGKNARANFQLEFGGEKDRESLLRVFVSAMRNRAGMDSTLLQGLQTAYGFNGHRFQLARSVTSP